VNKYFAAVAVPVVEGGAKTANWLIGRDGLFFNPDAKKSSEDEEIAVSYQTKIEDILAGEKKQYRFELFIGPKDKRLFDKDEYFTAMGFVHTIDFMGCCCPASIIRPMAFFILASMNWLYVFIPNYGVVIIIFVFIIRLLIHPLTKKSQISMSKMQTLGPKVEEIKKKYANNKQEMQRKMMEVYKEHGASPIKGMLPMFIQMPIWIALYSSIYSNIDLRGAEFLPFWITDLSAPDALISFKAFTLPLFGKISSFNLLPIMMGVAFYLQQKLTPKAATASTNPQLEQQQKMMMIMMPIMFPLLLYKAPSGLNLYIMASTFAGVIEQYVIRKHIREKEEQEKQGLVTVTSKTGGKSKKKKGKPFYKSFR
jgi:YidC/Oxa1 family membrane protein insertase